MADTPDPGSVRVEFEDGSTSTAPQVNPGRGGVSRTTIALGVGALLVVGIILLAVRPEESSVPIAESSTTTPTPPTTTTLAEIGTDRVNEQGLFVQTTETQEFESIVRAPVGFLALSWEVGRDGSPVLKRSVDGISWTSYEVRIPDDGADFDSNEGPIRSFQGLIRIEDGYAMVMSTVTLPQAGTASTEPEVRLRRLTSFDGATWETDPAFDEMVVNQAHGTVDLHTQDLFLTREFSNSNDNEELVGLFVEHALDGVEYADGGRHEGVCWISDMDETRLVLYFCDSGREITLGPEDLLEPDEFERFGRCALYMAQVQANGATVTVNDRSSGPSELGGSGSGVRMPIVFDSGAIVSVDFGPPAWFDRRSCDPFVELDEMAPPAVVIWELGDRSRPMRVDLADSLGAMPLLGTRTRPAAFGREILFVGESSVQSINIDTGVQKSVLALPPPVSDVSSARLTSGEAQLVLVNQGGVTVFDLSSDATRSVTSAAPLSGTGYLEIVYADDEVAFVSSGSAMYKVELPDLLN